MADIAVEAAIQLLTPLITSEISLISGLPDDVRAIKDELLSISAFLKNAEERAVGDEVTKVWVKQVRTLAYDIEDVIEEYNLFQKESSFGKAKNYLLFRVRGMATDIKSIRQRAIDIGRSRDSYRPPNNVVVEQGDHTYDATNPVTMYTFEQSELVGVESPRREIIELLRLREHNTRTSTVVVIGMRGLGKTTVVRCIYNDLTIRGFFPMRAWISMSRTRSRLDILKSMVKQFYEADDENMQLFRRVSNVNHLDSYVTKTNYVDWINSRDRRTLQGLVRRYLEKERYLIIFDNVQDGDLEMVPYIKHVLPSNHKDNKILVTTRFENVAHALLDDETCHGPYRLKPLPWQLAWMLFCKKTFQRCKGICPPLLEDLARGIVQKCEGLPPAIIAIGCLLSTKLNDVIEWQKVYNSLGFYLEKNHHLTGIYGILIRNYYDLPYYLKPCFLYFGLFPKGYLVDRMRLIRLWVAESFITKGRDSLTPEEVAEEYLNELISMSLVEVGYRDPTGRPSTLRVHEFLHEIILSKLEELSFCQILSSKCCIIDEKPRRLSIHKDYKLDDAGAFKSITKGKSSIRCLFTFELTHDILTKVITTTFLRNVHLLKVLDLRDAPITVVPWAVCKLRNLRYLSLRNTRVRSLPNSIGKLQDLQTLDLKNTLIRELPVEINMLYMLRHLLTYSYEPDFTYSSHVQKVNGMNMPQGTLVNFVELQKLAFVNLSNGTKVTKELRNLRRLGIIGLKLKGGKDLCAAIEEMKYLQALNVYSTKKSEMIDLEHFQSPPKTLKRLYLNGALKSFPRWIFDLHNLVKIRLRWSNLHDSSPFQNLSALPNLVELQLLEAYKGEFLEIASGGFRNLKILHLLDLHGLECLLINVGALPLLEELSIGESPKLQVPSEIKYLRNLNTLNFFNMPKHFNDCIHPGEHYYSIVQHVPEVFFRLKCAEGFWKTYTLR